MKAIVRRRAAGVTAAAMMFSSCLSFGLTASAEGKANENVFTFTADSVTAENADGSGFKIKGTELTISEAGTYTVSGQCAKGSIKVKKGTKNVVLILDSIELTALDTAPLTVGKESEVQIQVKGENTLIDGEAPADENSTDAETAENFEGAAVKVKSGATAVFTGTGTLNIDGSSCKNGIKGASAAAVVIGGDDAQALTLKVNAKKNAVASDGSVTVNSGILELTADEDAIKSSPEDDDSDSAGTVTINGGDITVYGGEDGVQADGGFAMKGGILDITAAGGHTKTAEKGGKGIKAGKSIDISGGSLYIDAADDGMHLNGESGDEKLSITDGRVKVKASDDGIKSDYYVVIGTEDGKGQPFIDVRYSTEGIEGSQVDLWSGKGSVLSCDDGINAANKNAADLKFAINIHGGNWYINANGDGLDSNGDLNISGGDTTVFGSPNGGNAALDYGNLGNSFTVSGGSVAGIGMGNMANAPTSGRYIMFGNKGGFGGPGMPPPPGMGMSVQGGQGQPPQGGQGMPPMQECGEIIVSKGTKFAIKDSQGNIIYSAVGVKDADNVTYASDKLKSGETYTLVIDGEDSLTTDAQEGQPREGGDFPPPPPDGGQPGQSPFGDIITGDVNGDRKINAADIVKVAAHIKGIKTLDWQGTMAADTDGNSAVNAADIVAIAAHIKGIKKLENQNFMPPEPPEGMEQNLCIPDAELPEGFGIPDREK